jgi:hypothetical protein
VFYIAANREAIRLCRNKSQRTLVTDSDWFDTHSAPGALDEVNFWQPSASTAFLALKAGAPLLFKLHSLDNYVVRALSVNAFR